MAGQVLDWRLSPLLVIDQPPVQVAMTVAGKLQRTHHNGRPGTGQAIVTAPGSRPASGASCHASNWQIATRPVIMAGQVLDWRLSLLAAGQPPVLVVHINSDAD
ncbi:hypothetical protein ABMA28_000670 [Loxostege sticticalis]|uniref:Uncharacterized protein n=1 Tax=Loxostege sticticalis TaxID=481309 RepID=A0ABD0T353_LOXSC